MRKVTKFSVIIVLVFLLFFPSCGKRTEEKRLFLFCEIDVRFGSSSFNGYVKILSERERVEIEFLGPFGNHLFSIRFEGNRFLGFDGIEPFWIHGFQFDFKEMLRDFVSLLGHEKRRGKKYSFHKESYVLTYDHTENDPKICFDKAEGTVCLRILGEKSERLAD